MDYYWIQNTEDGVKVTLYQHNTIMRRIEEETSLDILPECRAVFIDHPPNPYTPTNHVLIVKGTSIIPQPVSRVTEWELS